jgi:hypothetical protein
MPGIRAPAQVDSLIAHISGAEQSTFLTSDIARIGRRAVLDEKRGEY